MIILIFSRGRGHGHAIPDIAIATEIMLLRPDSEIIFASYGTGLATLRAARCRVIDLQLDERNRFNETLIAASRAIEATNPDIVVCHEEFAAVTAAKIHERTSVFLSAWLPKEATIPGEAVALADHIILLSNPGLFARPPGFTGTLRHVGPVVRRMSYSREDRSRLREATPGLQEGLLIAVVAGGWSTEERVPIADTVLGAYSLLPNAPKHLVWLAGADRENLKERAASLFSVEILGFLDPIDKLLAAADLVITKGTFGITCECAALGIPSIALSSGINPMDDFLVPRFQGTTWLNASALTPATLAAEIQACNMREKPVPIQYDGAMQAAEYLIRAAS